ncbi:hypothetical protein Droror1_Dr00000255 [Drosera rotundifolia]
MTARTGDGGENERSTKSRRGRLQSPRATPSSSEIKHRRARRPRRSKVEQGAEGREFVPRWELQEPDLMVVAASGGQVRERESKGRLVMGAAASV